MASHLLSSRRFLPLFLTQFLGTFNDQFFKNAVIILVTYYTSDQLRVDPHTLLTLSGMVYAFPYLVFCATAGKLADKFDKALLARIIKYAELGFMAFATVGFYFHLIGFLFVVLFCMGAHSAFFSPVKYSLMPDQLNESELMEGNAFMETATFIAMLLGTLGGGLLVLRPHGELLVSTIVVVVALLGVLSSKFIPHARICDPSVRVRANLLAETFDIISYVFKRRLLRKGALANSWFWFIGVTFLTQLPPFAKQVLGANENVVTLFFTSFSVGTGIGAVACGMILGGRVSTMTVRFAALVMSIFIFDFYWICPHSLSEHQGALLSADAFLAQPSSWRLVFDVFVTAIAGGFYMVPLYALLQQRSEPKHRAQVMACNNVLNVAFMVTAAALALVLYELHFTVAEVFLAVAILNTGVTAWLFTAGGRLADDR